VLLKALQVHLKPLHHKPPREYAMEDVHSFCMGKVDADMLEYAAQAKQASVF